jgi:hypothetical protein
MDRTNRPLIRLLSNAFMFIIDCPADCCEATVRSLLLLIVVLISVCVYEEIVLFLLSMINWDKPLMQITLGHKGD